MKVYLSQIDPSGEGGVKTIKAVRDALRVIDPQAKAQQASQLLEEFLREGTAHIADADPPTAARMQEILEAGGCASVVDPDETWIERRRRAAEPPEEVSDDLEEPDMANFAPAAYATAIALVVAKEGNPAAAAALAITLGTTTSDRALYDEVVELLAEIYPWVEVVLRASGMWPA